MRNTHHRSIWTSLFLLGILFATTQLASAQAMVSAERGAEITPFAQTALVSPDWGPTRNLGYTFGVDYTRFIRSIVQPSLEFRMTSANGATVNERSYTGGLKLQTAIRGIQPYGLLLVGAGFIHFNYPIPSDHGGLYTSDQSAVYSAGGGAQFTLRSQWQARAEFTYQHWNLEPETLTPMTLSVGIAYSLPFHNGRAH